eukprot:TRINITY_DN15582_c0_g1_i1.p1 TRINITY_DN15582_c0_g1~~TRINITY_DN15582_c0_g1_i1.p1  ORF type:complete len:359 (-),score=63.09 TRINITY_DN15582_c0_g1_i1:41-1090(-)
MARQQMNAVIVGLLVSITLVSAGTGCVSPTGETVDWWVVMKFPSLKNSSDALAQSGYGYTYTDSNNPGQFTEGAQGLDKADGPVAKTLAVIYTNDTQHTWMMWNDEPPKGAEIDSYGHCKGALAYDRDGGFYLVHSVPRYPAMSFEGYTYPFDERTYGQSMFCMTLNPESLNDVAECLQYDNPHIYDFNTPIDMFDVAPKVNALINGEVISDAGSLIKNFETVGGLSLTMFGKNHAWNQELYEDLVAPELDSNLHCETWIRSPPLPSFCKPSYKYDVVNVKGVEYTEDIRWSETEDHSKWAVTDDGSYACIGDINRMSSQAGRGGGTVCMNNEAMNKALTSWIAYSADC